MMIMWKRGLLVLCEINEILLNQSNRKRVCSVVCCVVLCCVVYEREVVRIDVN